MAQVLESRNIMIHACSLVRSLEFSGYDIHHVLKYLDQETDVKGLPKNTQSFRTVTVGKLHKLLVIFPCLLNLRSQVIFASKIQQPSCSHL